MLPFIVPHFNALGSGTPKSNYCYLRYNDYIKSNNFLYHYNTLNFPISQLNL